MSIPTIPHPLIGLANNQGHLLGLLFYISLCVNSHLISCPMEVSFYDNLLFTEAQRLLFKRMHNPLGSGGADFRPRQSEAMARGLWPSGCTALKHWHPGLQSLPITEGGAWCPANKSAHARAGSRSPSQIKTMDVSCICLPWQGQPSWQRH